jgi:hypothetical protein
VASAPAMSTARVLFALLSLTVLAANVDTLRRIRLLANVTRAPLFVANELLGSVVVLALVVVPRAVGRLHPSREDLTWAILLSFAAGFLSVSALVLSVFDTAMHETAS